MSQDAGRQTMQQNSKIKGALSRLSIPAISNYHLVSAEATFHGKPLRESIVLRQPYGTQRMVPPRPPPIHADSIDSVSIRVSLPFALNISIFQGGGRRGWGWVGGGGGREYRLVAFWRFNTLLLGSSPKVHLASSRLKCSKYCLNLKYLHGQVAVELLSPNMLTVNTDQPLWRVLYRAAGLCALGFDIMWIPYSEWEAALSRNVEEEYLLSRISALLSGSNERVKKVDRLAKLLNRDVLV